MQRVLRAGIITTLVLGLVVGSLSCGPAPTPAATPAPAATSKPTPAASPQPEVIHWKAQNSYFTTPSPNPAIEARGGMGVYGEEWVKWVEDMSKGRLKIDLLPPGSVCAAKDVLSAVQAGTLDMAMSHFDIYHAGVIPEANIIATSWIMKDVQQVADFFYLRGAQKIMQEVYSKVGIQWYVLPIDPYYSVHSVKPIRSLADVKGLKIRATGGFAQVFAKFGASTVVIPAEEGYMALKLGTVDALHWGISILEEAKLYEVVKYTVVEPLRSAGELCGYINMKSWEKLPPDLRELIDKNTPGFMLSIATRLTMYDRYLIAKAARQYGIELVNWPAEDGQALVQAGWEVTQQFGKQSPTCGRLVAILGQQLKDLGMIR